MASLEFQPRLARRIRHRANPAVIQIAAAIEYHALDALGDQPFGDRLAERLKEKGITKVVFDRNGFLYHGRIKAVADAARQAGLEF